ncbi:calcium-binding protein [Streptomyces sp. NPDC052687]|uniref:calcium-binding protein n=1 Tax=Streptomyces sp. NPDC052687 TaxID=3154759 RepID=UPI0034396130
MRIRATLGVATGALALTVVAVPAAQADEIRGDTTISNISVNGGKPVVVGASATKTITVSFTVKDDSGVDKAMALPYHGANLDNADSAALPHTEDDFSVCTKVNATTANCTANYPFVPGGNAINKVAGGWKLWVFASGKDGDYVQKENAKSFSLQRLSKLTVNASPEPVKKGKTLTVTGKLTRANWDANKYSGYSGQSVKLQFRKKGSSTYTTLKTIKTNTYGDLKTTVTATADGYYRYSFAGTSTTPAVSAAGDYVDVQ